MPVFHGAAELPYVTDVVDGARSLLVCFPKLRLGGAKAPVGQRAELESLRAHRLLVGADAHTYIGPQATLAGARTAVELIEHERTRLEIEREDVIALGTSMGAICALYMGLRAAAGRILAGGPPVNMGGQLRSLSKVEGPTNAAKSAAGDFLKLARNGNDVRPATLLDDLIYNAAAATTQPVTIDLFVSETDRTRRATRRLWKTLQSHPTITCTLHAGEYRTHADIRAPFFAWAREQLAELCAEPARRR